MKILYLESFDSESSTEAFIARAFERLGHTVVRLREATSSHASIVDTAINERPDLFLFAKANFREADISWPAAAEPVCKMISTIRPYVGKVVAWLFDLMAADFAPERFKWACRVAAECDVFALTDGSTAPLLPNSFVLPQGCPDDYDKDCPWDVPIVGNVLFTGTAYHQERQQFVRAFARKFGGGFRHENGTFGPALTRLVRSFRVCVGPWYPSRPEYESNRRMVICGHGGLFVAPLVESAAREGWLPNENYLVISRDPDVAASEVQAILEMDRTWLNSIRLEGFAHAHEKCKYTDRVRTLLAHLDALPAMS